MNGVLRPPTIGAILIKTSRPAEMAEFYQKGLDLPAPTKTGQGHLGFDLSGVYLGFEEVDEATPTPSPITVWFYVKDIINAVDQFQRSGASVKEEPRLQSWGETTALVCDPDGNVIGLLSLPE